MERVEIRPATPSDAPLLAALAERTWMDVVGDVIGYEDMAAHLADVRARAGAGMESGGETVLVAEADGAPVGYVAFGDVDIPGVDVRVGDQELRRLYVETSRQGQGIGRRLVTAALAHPRLAAATRIVLQVWEENGSAIRLYESFGFRRVGTTTFTMGRHVQAELVLMLEPD